MNNAWITVQQTRSPIRRVGKLFDAADAVEAEADQDRAPISGTPATRGMIRKVSHLVRVIRETTELDKFVEEVRAIYHELLGPRINCSTDSELCGLIRCGGNLPVIPFRIGAARADSGLKLLPEEVAATNPSRD